MIKSILELSRLITTKNKTQTALIVIMLILSMTLLGCLVAGMSNVGKVYRFAEPLVKRDGIYLRGALNSIEDLEVLEGDGDIESIEYAGPISVRGNYFVKAGTKGYCEKLKVPLEKGKWHTEAPKVEGCVNAVATADSGLDVGSRITLSRVFPGHEDLSLVITGILPERAMIPLAMSTGTPWTVDDWFEKREKEDKNGLEQMPELLIEFDDFDKYERPFDIFVLFKDGTKREKIEEYTEYFRNYPATVVLPLGEINENSVQQNRQNLKAFLPLTLIFGLLCVTSLVVVTLICVNKNKNIISSYYLVGAGKYHIFCGLLLHQLKLFLIALPFYGILCYLVNLQSFNPFYPEGIFYHDVAAQVLVPIGYLVATIAMSFMFVSREIGNLTKDCILEE